MTDPGDPQWGAPQPGGYGGPSGVKPNNNLVLAIVSTLLCCLPAGVVSIVYATQVDSKWNAGDRAGAELAAKNSRTWSYVSIGLGLAGIVIAIIFTVAAGGSGSTY